MNRSKSSMSAAPRLLVLGLWSLVFGSSVSAQTVVSTSFASGQNVTVTAPTSLETSGTVTVASGAVVTFRATTSMTLKAGFHGVAGNVFRAFLFVDSDGDGMDDAWESRHGLNPASDDAAGNPDGDGLTNLQEYLLGTNPTVSNSADAGNTNNFKVHRPQQP